MADLERRSFAECRIEPDGKHLKGYAIVFNQKSVDLGGFREVILPEAVDRTLKEALDVRALVDHDSSKVLGRTTAGTLALRKKSNGLYVDIDPPNTTASRDILESVRRGDVTGMSFAFRVLEDEWRESEGMALREVLDMRISEVSIVSFPAYPDTQISLRALERFKAQQPGHSVDWWRKWHQTQLAR